MTPRLIDQALLQILLGQRGNRILAFVIQQHKQHDAFRFVYTLPLAAEASHAQAPLILGARAQAKAAPLAAAEPPPLATLAGQKRRGRRGGAGAGPAR